MMNGRLSSIAYWKCVLCGEERGGGGGENKEGRRGRGGEGGEVRGGGGQG